MKSMHFGARNKFSASAFAFKAKGEAAEGVVSRKKPIFSNFFVCRVWSS